MQGDREHVNTSHSKPKSTTGKVLSQSQAAADQHRCSLLERGEVATGEVYDATNGFQQESGCAPPNSLHHTHSTLLLCTCTRWGECRVPGPHAPQCTPCSYQTPCHILRHTSHANTQMHVFPPTHLHTHSTHTCTHAQTHDTTRTPQIHITPYMYIHTGYITNTPHSVHACAHI